jgi:hypothetical protein
MASFHPLSAKNAKVRITTPSSTSFVFTAKRWTVTPRVDPLDITNFEGEGFADWLGGIKECEFTIEADYDTANDPFFDPPDIVAGAIIGPVLLYTDDIPSDHWNFAKALVVETPMTAAVRELITITLTCKAKGTFTEPGVTIAEESDENS